MKPSRKTQPYKGQRGPAGATKRAMKRGKPALSRHPMDAKRKLQKKNRQRRRKTVAYYLR